MKKENCGSVFRNEVHFTTKQDIIAGTRLINLLYYLNNLKLHVLFFFQFFD